MKHGIAGRKLGRSLGQRNALRRTMLTQLFQHERLTTTEAKAKFIRSEAEKLVTLARNSANPRPNEDEKAHAARKVHALRLVIARLSDPKIAKKLFETIAPRYAKRPGGYTRILKLGPRQGDAADMAIIEFVEE